jgi:hypothetical protein
VSTTIGDVDFIVNLDGEAIPAEAEILGTEAGKIASDAFARAYRQHMNTLSNKLRGQMASIGRIQGKSFALGMFQSLKPGLNSVQRAITSSFAGNGNALTRFGGSLHGVNHEFGDLVRSSGTFLISSRRVASSAEGLTRTTTRLGDAFRRFGNVVKNDMKEFGPAISRKIREVGNAYSYAGAKLKGFFSGSNGAGGGSGPSKSIDKQNKGLKSMFSNLSANTRQWIAIIAAIASAGNAIAVLGSVAGSTLVLTGVALASISVGAAIVGSAFAAVTGKVTDASKAMKPIITIVKGLQGAFKAFRSSINDRFFQFLASPLQDLGRVIKALTPAFLSFAGVAGHAIGRLFREFEQPAALKQFGSIIRGLGQVFKPLVAAAGSFGHAILNVFKVAMPFAVVFARGIQSIAHGFSEWTASAPGRAALLAFFKHGAELSKPILKFIGAIGKGLSTLVTPEAIKDLQNFFNNLTASLPFVFDLITNIGRLDLFGTIASVLNSVGNSLIPLIDFLGAAGRAATTLIKLFVGPLLGALISGVSSGFKPFAKVLDYAGKNMEQFGKFIRPLVKSFGVLGDAFSQVGLAIVKEFLPNLDGVEQLGQNGFKDAMKNMGKFVTDFAQKIIDHIPDILKFLHGVQKLIDFLVANGPKILDAAKQFVKLGLKIAAIAAYFSDPIKAAKDFFGWMANILGIQTKVNTNAKNLKNFTGSGSHVQQKTAVGGIFNGAQSRIIGEAGPEAVVPLRRNLSQVSKDVRALSAFAQGIGTGSARGNSSSTSDSSRTVSVERGAFTIVSPDPHMAGLQVLDRLATIL